MKRIIRILHNTARTAAMLLFALLAAQTAGAQDLSSLSVYTEEPTVDGGQSTNWASGEDYGSLVDGYTGTKYGLSDAAPWVEFHYAQPITPTGYALWTADDTEGERNPTGWIIKAKNRGDAGWTTLASVDNSANDKLPMADNTETRFALKNSTAYQFFRFEATRNVGADGFQLAELQFLYYEDPTSMNCATISGIDWNYNYTGQAIPITFSVTDANGDELALGTHYTATLGETALGSNTFSVTDEGNYCVTVTAKEGSGYTGSKIFNFIVSNCPEGMSIDDSFNNGEVGFIYVNMPKTGEKTVTLADASVTTFKVYDDGGKGGKYSNNCKGSLILTAPLGYVLQLSGSINTEIKYDSLTVYDGASADAPKLLDKVSSDSRNTPKAISTWSTGRSMMLYFASDGNSNYPGLDLTVTLVDASTEYDITIANPAEGGSVAASVGDKDVSTVKVGNVVTLTATPASGYVLSDLSVKDAYNNDVAVTDMLWYTGTNTATFTMPGTAVTVTPTFTNDLTSESLYINMPKTGEKTDTIPSGVQSFKVYDDGGKIGSYSGKCKGSLILTAPLGYVLRLSGSINTEPECDDLTVYDGASADAPKLLDEVSSGSRDTPKDINTVMSTGRSMMLYFHSDGSSNYDGLDLTVTLVDASTEYDITIENPAEGGSVAASVGGNGVSTAKVGDVVTLTATPASGYVLSGLSVKDAFNNDVAVNWNVFANTATFTMRGAAVTVTPTFTNDLTSESLYINMPKTGTKTATIPSGVQSLKVYDDGGKDGNYSGDCKGSLILTAPTGYVLQLSGSINTEPGCDSLTVYDGDSADAPKLLDKVSSDVDGTPKGINTGSTGRSMMLYFYSDRSRNYPGLDLTVTLVDASIEYDITIANPAEGGSVAASVGGKSVSTAKVGNVVTLTATPASGYVLSDLSVKDAYNNDVAVTDMLWYTGTNTATFTMPSTAVTVTPTFTNDLTSESLYINMPKTGEKTVTLDDASVTTFKVYDDGGKGGNYSDGYKGSLTLTAPSGYVLRLSGSINIEHGYDNLTVYDGTSDNETKLLDEVSSDDDDIYNDINTVVSSGRSMMLYFFSDGGSNFDGLDLTVTLVPITYTVSFNANGGTGDAMAAQEFTYDAAQALTANSYARAGYTFAGWATEADGEKVYDDQQSVSNLASTPGASVELFATWTKNELALLDNDSSQPNGSRNADLIGSASGDGKQYAVTLQGRTLYKDGSWNTLCLPFDVGLSGSALEGAVARPLSEASISGTELRLTFGDAVNTLLAGTPYVIKWAKADGYVDDDAHNIVSPVFEGVSISDETHDYDTDVESVTTDERVRFVGTCSSAAFDGEDQSILLMGAANTLYYAATGAGIGSCRAYFKIGDDSAKARRLSVFHIDFGDGDTTTGIVSVEDGQLRMDDAWYTLDGRRLAGEPTQSGIFIKNGKKVSINQ